MTQQLHHGVHIKRKWNLLVEQLQFTCSLLNYLELTRQEANYMSVTCWTCKEDVVHVQNGQNPKRGKILACAGSRMGLKVMISDEINPTQKEKHSITALMWNLKMFIKAAGSTNDSGAGETRQQEDVLVFSLAVGSLQITAFLTKILQSFHHKEMICLPWLEHYTMHVYIKLHIFYIGAKSSNFVYL